MSLIIACCGSKKAVIGGDKRSITFIGSCSQLEDELYTGRIRTDEDLKARAVELGACLQVSDGREKVWRRGDLLVGEVTEISAERQKRRRIYLAPGAFIITDINDSDARITSRGRASCLILGNRLTRDLASRSIRDFASKGFDDKVIDDIFKDISSKTASVSQEHTILSSAVKHTDPEAEVLNALAEDCRASGWKLDLCSIDRQ